MHHCIQGWTGIAKWGGLPMKSLVDLVRPKPNAKVVAFFSFGGSLYGGAYYDTQSLENVLKAQCLLASEMNGKPLTEVYGAPLRLRVENQLGVQRDDDRGDDRGEHGRVARRDKLAHHAARGRERDQRNHRERQGEAQHDLTRH